MTTINLFFNFNGTGNPNNYQNNSHSQFLEQHQKFSTTENNHYYEIPGPASDWKFTGNNPEDVLKKLLQEDKPNLSSAADPFAQLLNFLVEKLPQPRSPLTEVGKGITEMQLTLLGDGTFLKP